MRVSCNWLSRHVDLSGVDLVALGRRFTMAVAELDGIERIGHDLDRVVVGHVLAVQGLEGKKVRLTRVDTGAHGVREIICGAPNVATGQKVAVALPGQKLGAMEIKVAEVAGVVSHGMICSEKELGLSDDHAGIMVLAEGAPVGVPLAEAIPGLADTIYVIDNKSLTHRPDCWGHRGIAREIAALLGRPMRPLAAEVAFGEARPLTIEVHDQNACPRYTATTMSGVHIAPSPQWLRLLLQRVGTRPINNVVDATNFAMLDTGNPLHAFDRRQIAGDRIVVRAAADGERFTTLDGQERVLSASDLVIADAARAVALAGVMGGLDSEIKDDTSEVVLEAASFDPARVRMTAQRLGLRTESSARFEKSLDPLLVDDSARVFLALVAELCPGARVTSAFMDVARPYPAPTVIPVEVGYIHERLGFAIGKQRVVEILRGLEFGVEADGDRLAVTVPTWRATKDIGIAEDLVEEVGRVFGYDNIPPVAPLVPVMQPDRNAKKKFERAARAALTGSSGLDELQTYSFDDDVFLARIGVVPGERVRLRNPITTEEPCMRTAIAPHLLKVLDKNARGFEAVGVFEIGRVFTPRAGALPDQPTTLGVLVAEVALSTQPGEPSWFLRGKALLQGLVGALERRMPELVPGRVSHAYVHPVRQAALVLEGREIGMLAEIHPLVLHKLGVRHTGVLLELDLDALRASSVAPIRYRPLPRFPAVFRDFAVLVDKSVPAGVVGRAIADAAPELIADVTFQSVWSGPGIPETDKSLAWSVTFRHGERTLTDAEAREAEAKIWAAVTAIGGRARA